MQRSLRESMADLAAEREFRVERPLQIRRVRGKIEARHGSPQHGRVGDRDLRRGVGSIRRAGEMDCETSAAGLNRRRSGRTILRVSPLTSRASGSSTCARCGSGRPASAQRIRRALAAR